MTDWLVLGQLWIYTSKKNKNKNLNQAFLLYHFREWESQSLACLCWYDSLHSKISDWKGHYVVLE